MINILIVEDDPAIAEIHRRSSVQRLPGFEVLGWRWDPVRCQGADRDPSGPDLVLLGCLAARWREGFCY